MSERFSVETGTCIQNESLFSLCWGAYACDVLASYHAWDIIITVIIPAVVYSTQNQQVLGEDYLFKHSRWHVL